MTCFRTLITTLLLFFFSLVISAQSEVALLRVEAERSEDKKSSANDGATRLPFELERNLIWIKASVDEQDGYYILDTGAPTLLINDRGEPTGKKNLGQGSGGTVALAEHQVMSFELGGINQGAQSAYRIDLRSMEERTGRLLHGMVGYEQLNEYELLIDYPARELQLLPSKNNDLHANSTPQFSVRFTYVAHLPVIELKQGKRKLRFAIDTGAGSNLLHISKNGQLPKNIQLDGLGVNVHGLDGNAIDRKTGHFTELSLEKRNIAATDFVLTDLSHLQPEEGNGIDGILGTSFLKDYKISIDYRKGKVYFW